MPWTGLRLPREVQLLRKVLRNARKVYEFEVRGLRVEAGRVSFYINDADEVAVILLDQGHLPQKKVPILNNLKKHFFAFD
jgi:hypothetical protein